MDFLEAKSLKKNILGSCLILCGFLNILTYSIREAIFFASPSHITQGGRPLFLYMGYALLIIGIYLVLRSFSSKT